MSYLDNIKIVLVETSHTGNMGSAARAMKTMGLTNLCLVNPIIKPDSQSISLAAGASDIIKQAQIFLSLEAAVADCSLVIGTSARPRSLQWPNLTPKECGEKIIAEACRHAQVALVFGRERVGLTNDELF
ncbi:SpoU rRNA Methylase family [Gilliamella apicola SCGC AB-598-I20]|nr:SpoU rRNA Methylase family [Gilliamella apicola SCGC AB-598-I20]